MGRSVAASAAASIWSAVKLLLPASLSPSGRLGSVERDRPPVGHIARVPCALELRGTEEEGGVARIEGYADLQGSTVLIVFTLVQYGDAWLIDNIA